MSGNIAIRMENLGKRYRYGGPQAVGHNLRQDLTDWVCSAFRRGNHKQTMTDASPKFQAPNLKSDVSDAESSVSRHPTFHEIHEQHLNSDPNYFWALKHIDLEVREGEVVGIIGRNGAGKSTLLKILSRITPPTVGRVTYHGRVASLLEIGTGFHRELTGRENIYLNGSILGMRRAEIAKKFAEIVAFAEVEKFIHTPVKFYSSGMYVRLAFAVAAHLEAEILLVDEVLAVGDADFQKKCLGKMEDVAKGGRTVLFISHNMGAITGLCSRGILLSRGELSRDGRPTSIVDHYLSVVLPSALVDTKLAHRTDRWGSGTLRLTDFYVEDIGGRRLTTVRSGMDVVFVLEYSHLGDAEPKNVDVGFSIGTDNDQIFSVFYSSYSGQSFRTIPKKGEFRCIIPRLCLAPGRYPIGAAVLVNGIEADCLNGGVGLLDVEPGDFYGTGHSGWPRKSVFLVQGSWSVRQSAHE